MKRFLLPPVNMSNDVDPEVRSRMMSAIRGKDTAPEMMVRRYLHSLGFRYRLHNSELAGQPDLVLKSHRAVIFVHGCFWHQHAGCHLAVMPKRNREFWQSKLARNRERDSAAVRELANQGWRVLTVWECGLTKAEKTYALQTLAATEQWIRTGAEVEEIPARTPAPLKAPLTPT